MFNKRKIIELESLLNARTKALEKAELRVETRNKFINEQTKEIQELKNKIIDLENNLELVTYNLSAQKKKLYVPDCVSK